MSGALLALGISTAACSSGGHKSASHKSVASKKHKTTATSSTTTTTTPPTSLPVPTTTSTTHASGPPLVALPDVIGLRIEPARATLSAAGLDFEAVNHACSRGTTESESVVDALILPGPPPNVTVGASALVPGDRIPKGTTVGIAWSGCFGGGTTVPNVVGLKFGVARQTIVGVGLTWTCQTQGTTTIPHSTTVLAQNPPPGTPEAAGSTVAFVMERCPAAGP